jgi:hypothetical protein
MLSFLTHSRKKKANRWKLASDAIIENHLATELGKAVRPSRWMVSY